MSDLETASRSVIAAHQLARLQAGFSRILPHNRFYHQKLNVRAGLAPAPGLAPALSTTDRSPTIESLEDLTRLPFTTKQELVADQQAHPLFGSNLTYPLSDYIRLHQTSGTTGG